ncbi:c-type cytochrome biogenesis protein CcmI [Acidisphaera sp. S103]|uniref:c-type cytochrome biogenesis protein CcmI n=1 Tax=Acidisphaera sp. S103 TaxID=1747223 RepID=UPI00131D2657|nr:c-type cytochrome biogenesis protein CcmI [Acidisphaera sp. S103]
MILPFLLALLAFLALLPILAPLLRGSRPTAARATFDQAVYRDQLRELDRDIARGVLTLTEADAARLEVQRRLLAADRQPTAPQRLTRSPILAIIVFMFVAAGSLASYLWLGAPGIPDEPFSARQVELAKANTPSPLERATETLAEKLKQNPSDANGWLLYGHSLAMLREWDQAEAAYSKAIALGQNSPDVLGDHAEIMVMQAGGTVTPAAEAAFQQVLKTDPSSGSAHYYLAVAAMQAGEPRKAIEGFQTLLAQLPEDSSLRPQLGQKVAQAAQAAGIPVPELAKGTPPPAPGPDAKTMADAANMPDAQRRAMIDSMVAGLAAKQAADPANLDGWLRLGRAYAVLHQADKAADAYDKAAALKPGDTSIRLQEVRALLQDHAPTDKLPPRVIDLLNHVQTTDPDQPLVLWYLGIAAAQDAHLDDARRYWTKLLTLVPPGSDDARMLRSALDALSAHRSDPQTPPGASPQPAAH